MGQELACSMRYRSRRYTGKAYLETDYVLFRGDERLKVQFRDLTEVKATGGILKLEFAGGPASLELGAAAAKWAQKILHPPSRLDKLGVKPGLAIAIVGKMEPQFLGEVEAQVTQAKADLLFFAAEKSADLLRIEKLKSRLTPKGALWIVYPKGVERIREIDVLNAGRAAGLKDTKVASFSATHTALRFNFPRTAP